MTAADLSGRVALVTGGTRGLGLEIAQAFAEHGADIVLASRKEQACADIAERIASATGRTVLGVPCHVGDWEDCDRLVETAYERFGKIDVLVNNAGMSPLYSSLADVSQDLFDKVIAVNLRGPFRLSSLIGTRMQQQDGGSIINISSIEAIQGQPHTAPYSAAKAGLNALTTAFARAFGPTVRANTIMAGPFLTDVSRAWDMDAFVEAAERDIPMRRGGQPHEIVGAALYLATEASSYTSGATIKVDGGYAWAAG